MTTAPNSTTNSTTAPPPKTTTLNTTKTPTLNATTTAANGKKPVRGRKQMTKVPKLAPNVNSSELPATVKEIVPPAKPDQLLFAQLPGLEELLNADQDPGYLIPSNFAPQNPIPLNDETTAQTPIV